jgi:Xaa-Pro aminopeptidase
MKKIKVILAALIILALVSPVFATGKTNIYRERRVQIRAEIKEGLAILFAGEPTADAGAIDYHFRVDKNFFYLTGIKEPKAVLLIARKEGRFGGELIFVPGKVDKKRKEEIAGISGVPQILPLDNLDRYLPSILSGRENIYTPIPRTSLSSSPSAGIRFVNRIRERFPQLEIRDLSPVLTGMRMVKSEEELEIMKKAIGITTAGLSEAIRSAEPGIYEYQLQAVLEFVFHFHGAERCGFPSIVGSGPNSVIIHYHKNTRKIKPGELVVIDVGAEFSEYTGDITRTIPVSGKFTRREREIYGIVLEAQLRGIAACRPGATLSDVDKAARSYIEEMGYGKYFIHGVGHSLGLDVHDPMLPDTKLSPGMIITVEPGIYIPEENLGVRIEDDILITVDGHIVLSSIFPKKPEDIERLMGEEGVGNLIETGAQSEK